MTRIILCVTSTPRIWGPKTQKESQYCMLFNIFLPMQSNGVYSVHF